MNEIIYEEVRLRTRCRYYQILPGNVDSLIEDKQSDTLKITYRPEGTWKDLHDTLGLELVGSGKGLVVSTEGTKKFTTNTKLTINGLVLEKLVPGNYVFSLVIVRDSESRVVQTKSHTTIVINESDVGNPEFIEFLFYSGGLIYLRPFGPKVEGWVPRNFPKILIDKKDITLESSNSIAYTLRRRYNDYLIREVDYQDQFILELRRLLDTFGIELVRQNKETTLTKTHYVTYQIVQTPVSMTRPWRDSPLRNVFNYKQPVELSLHTTDMVLFHDFKKRYQNVDFLTNFTEFKTADKYGDRWTAAVKWGPITEDFNHVYGQDDNANFSFQCSFRCELFYYEVLDTRYQFLEEISAELTSEDNKEDD